MEEHWRAGCYSLACLNLLSPGTYFDKQRDSLIYRRADLWPREPIFKNGNPVPEPHFIEEQMSIEKGSNGAEDIQQVSTEPHEGVELSLVTGS